MSGKRASMLRDGLHVVIVGAPNAGKSSLLNFLAGREVAIISEEAGTTRDLLEVKLDLGGIPVYVTDTAGLRVTDSSVEKSELNAPARVWPMPIWFCCLKI